MAAYMRSQIAKLAGINPETLRYYENNGLIPAPVRTDNGYRLYSEETLSRLEFIKMAKFCGFTLSQIKRLFSKADLKAVDEDYFIDIIKKRVQRINLEISELEQVKAKLVYLANNVQTACRPSQMKVVRQALKME